MYTTPNEPVIVSIGNQDKMFDTINSAVDFLEQKSRNAQDAVMKNHFSKSTHEVNFVPYTKSKMEYIWNYPYIDCKDVYAIVDDNIENIRDIVLGCTLGNNIPKVIYPRRLEWMRPKHFDNLFGEIQYY